MMNKTEFLALIKEYGKGAPIDIDKIKIRGEAFDSWYYHGFNFEDVPGEAIAYNTSSYFISLHNLDIHNPPEEHVIFYSHIHKSHLTEMPDDILISAIEDLSFLEAYSFLDSLYNWISETFDVDMKTAKRYLVAGVGILVLTAVILVMMKR